MSNVKLNQEEVAGTLYRVFCHASGEEHSQPWEHLGLEEQGRWYLLAKHVEPVCEALDGKPYSLAAEELARIYAGWGEPGRSPGHLIAMEGVARHAMTLLDADDVSDLAELEQSWRLWAVQRRERLLIQTEVL